MGSTFGVALVIFTAFFSVYVFLERRTAVKAMQRSNGLSNPVGLWLGHLLFDSISFVFVASVIAIALAAASRFHGVGYLLSWYSVGLPLYCMHTALPFSWLLP
ncbi:hypothetical protein BV22DRAFT_594380 [Leucogyrophana mollusca]|uniref:Uncharacterized protein n=1 Tax=Leucogyrophana mollusca TaxID=85980 RepID=A0ACB8BCG4_9AGAM|nr:hypothetical protein BV22DRAFT_594380 [Leucogyrophana mollusca]